MSTIRAMAVFQGASGLPQDEFVNTFHFTGAGTYGEDSTLIVTALAKFYNFANTGHSGKALGEYLSPWILRDFVFKLYDMTAPKIRVPSNYPATLPVAPGQGLPEEVALVCSLHGSTPPASARRRGRIYIGPFGANAIAYATSSDHSGIAAALIGTLADAAKALIDEPLIDWCIRSVTPSENYVPIVSGYVDDAWDTQRRRGPDASARSSFIGGS